jgi:hypothetical protein
MQEAEHIGGTLMDDCLHLERLGQSEKLSRLKPSIRAQSDSLGTRIEVPVPSGADSVAPETQA